MNLPANNDAPELKAHRDSREAHFHFDPEAVARVCTAQLSWAATPLSERLRVVRRFRQQLAEQSQEVATSAAAPHRSPAEILTEEIIPLADACQFLESQAAKILLPRRIGRSGRPLWLGGVSSSVHREPYGIVLIISPGNYPLFLPGVQTLQALVAGNAVLLKPSPQGWRAAQELKRLLLAASLPPALIQVLSEDQGSVPAAIHSGVDKVFFTGSAQSGAQVLAQLSPHAIPATMELSGCDPVIIRTDANLDLAVRALRFGLRLNSGQTCIAPRRVFVSRSVATEFEGRLALAFAPCAPIFFSRQQCDRLLAPVIQALQEGAHLLAGRIVDGQLLVGPMILAGVRPSLPLLTEDIFSPLLMIFSVADDNEAVALANNCPYGLGATIFSRDPAAARSLAARLDAGIVVINDMIAPTADARLPFSGRKRSGFGVTRGPEGLLDMTQVKVVTCRRGNWRPHFEPPHDNDADLFSAYLTAAHGVGWPTRLRAVGKLFRAIWQRQRTR